MLSGSDPPAVLLKKSISGCSGSCGQNWEDNYRKDRRNLSSTLTTRELCSFYPFILLSCLLVMNKKYFQCELKTRVISLLQLIYNCIMQPEHNKINPPPNYTLICSADLFKIYSSLNQQTQTLTLLLYKFKLGKTLVYESIITTDSPLVESLGGMANLIDYLQDKSNIYLEDSQNILKIVSIVELKGSKRQIQIGRIQLKFNQEICDDIPEFSLKQIQQYCKTKKVIEGPKINQFFLSIVKYIKTNESKKVEEEYHELTEPLVKKIMLLGEGQELLKNKYGGISEEIGQLNLTISELDIKLQEKDKIIAEITENLHQNRKKLKSLQDHVEQEIQYKIVEAKQFMHAKLKQVFRQIDQNYEGIKKIMVNQYKMEKNINIEELMERPLKFQPRMVEVGDKTFFFSKVLKHNQIVLENNGLTACGGNVNRGKIALVNHSIGALKLKKPLEISMKFKIKQGPTNVLIGACNYERVRAMNYKVEKWDRDGHGGYYINSGAYSYSSYREEDNAAVKSFRFKEGDIINVTCSFEKKCLIFLKQKQEQKYVMQYDPSLQEDKLYFAVILHGVDSKIELHSD